MIPEGTVPTLVSGGAYLMRKAFFLASLALVLLSKCEKTSVAATNILIPLEQEVQMGKNFSRQIEADTAKYPLYRNTHGSNAPLVRYIDSLGTLIAETVDPRQGIEYEFEVVDVDSVVNAFAVPGGFIYMYTGLIKAAKTEEEIMGVLAHEIAHVTQRHGAVLLVDAYTTDFILDMVVGDSSALRTVLDAGTHIAFLKYERENEYEADSLAVEYLIDVNRNPNGMKLFLEYLHNQANPRWTMEVFSSHPETKSRIKAVQQQIAAKPSHSKKLTDNPYHEPQTISKTRK